MPLTPPLSRAGEGVSPTPPEPVARLRERKGPAIAGGWRRGVRGRAGGGHLHWSRSAQLLASDDESVRATYYKARGELQSAVTRMDFRQSR